MRFDSYYAFKDEEHHPLNTCSRYAVHRPFVLNCMGNFVTSSKFNTHNRVGRSDYYLLYVQSGELVLELPDGETVCTEGCFIIFPPETKYKYSHTPTNSLEYLWAHFTGSAVEDTLNEYGIERYPDVNRIHDDGGVRMRFLNMLDVARGPEEFKEAELSICIARLLLSLAKRMKQNTAQRLSRSLSYINKNYNTEIRISELARLENLSESRYNAVFREVMNASPHSYVTSMRISFACELLRTTDLSVKEIGHTVGYDDSHFFSRIFRKHMGVSPIEYRGNY